MIARLISTESAPPVQSQSGWRATSASPRTLCLAIRSNASPITTETTPEKASAREDSRAPAQLSHHGRLDGARETRGHREPDGQSRHAPGAPSGIVTDSSLWNRLKLLPSESLQRANQPMPGIGCLSSALPPSSRTLARSASMSSLPK